MKTKQLLFTTFSFLMVTCFATAQQQQPADIHLLAKTSTTAHPSFYYPTSLAPKAAYNPIKYKKFKKMRTAGIILTSAGTALIGGGVALISSGEKQSYDGYYYTESASNKTTAGVLCILLGVPSLGGGITMWAIGSNKMKKYGPVMSLNAAPGKLSIAYRF